MPPLPLCLLLGFGFLIGGCASAKQDPDAAPAYQTLAEEKFGPTITYTPNADSTLVLCIHTPEPSPRMPTPIRAYLVYDLDKSEIIYEEEGINGTVEWADAHAVRVTRTPGTVTGSETSGTPLRGYTVDVRTGHKQKR